MGSYILVDLDFDSSCLILVRRAVKTMLCTQLKHICFAKFVNATRKLILDLFFQIIYFNE